MIKTLFTCWEPQSNVRAVSRSLQGAIMSTALLFLRRMRPSRARTTAVRSKSSAGSARWSAQAYCSARLLLRRSSAAQSSIRKLLQTKKGATWAQRAERKSRHGSASASRGPYRDYRSRDLVGLDWCASQMVDSPKGKGPPPERSHPLKCCRVVSPW